MNNLTHAPAKARRAHHLDGLAALSRNHGLVRGVRLVGQPACTIGLHQHAVGKYGERAKAKRWRAQLSGIALCTGRTGPHADHAGVPERLFHVELRGIKQERAALRCQHMRRRGYDHGTSQLACQLVNEGGFAPAPNH